MLGMWREQLGQALLVLTLATAVTAHVRLTYPLARYMDFDFLDNARTYGPCGLGTAPEKDMVTPFYIGETFNVTWHLGVPHQGGYQLQILEGDRIMHWLTPEDVWQSVDEITAQIRQVTLPAGYNCTRCTLRVLRQAAEFGGVYGFWSCAEISIGKRTTVKDINCVGFPSENGKCICPRLYSGPNCQYRDDCWNGTDCAGHGQCIDLDTTSFPRKQCFCEMGWFGRNCSIESPVTDLEFNPMEYNVKTLSPGYIMYYKVLKASAELEVILQVQTDNWVAIGWRPSGTTISCKAFPDVTKKAAPVGSVKPVMSADDLDEDSEEFEIEEEMSKEAASKKAASSETEDSRKDTQEDYKEEETSEPEPELEGKSIREGESAEMVEKPEERADAEDGEEKQEEGKADGEAETEAEPEAEGVPEEEEKYKPKAKPTAKLTGAKSTVKLHVMDCTDIVIGTARGSLSRVLDYYTRDRSTPKEDEMYSGTQSLTAAIGRELDGITTILFRRKLKAVERSDYTITSARMDLIFARGQEQGNYIHHPRLGINGGPKYPFFYTVDEIKYHGKQGNLRGVDSIEFKKMVDQPESCSQSFVTPTGCTNNCDYSARWTLNSVTDTFTFTITAKQPSNTWTGIAFGRTRRMEDLDTVLGWVDNDGAGKLLDGFIFGRQSYPREDIQRDLTNTSVTYKEGKLTLQFSRRRITKDSYDHQFSDSDTNCYEVFYPVHGGRLHNGSPAVHFSNPIVPDAKLCIRNCAIAKRNVVASVRLLQSFKDEYKSLKSATTVRFINSWLPELTSNLKAKVAGIVNVQVKKLRSGSVYADLDVLYMSAGVKDDNAIKQDVSNALREEVADGFLAVHKADVSYFEVYTEAEFSMKDNPTTTRNPNRNADQNKIIRNASIKTEDASTRNKLKEIEIIMICVISVLVFVALIAVAVKCAEAKRSRRERTAPLFSNPNQGYVTEGEKGDFKTKL